MTPTADLAPLREGFEYEFSVLDPVRSPHIDPPSTVIFETLINPTAHGWKPGLAESWAVADDQLSWTFRLRSGAQFHDGTPCDARAVTDALEECRYPTSGSRQLWYWDPVDRVVAHGDNCIEVLLHHPYPRLPTLFAGTHTAIFRRSGAEVIGSGAYRLESWSEHAVEVVAADERARRSRISWIALPDDAVRTAAVERGLVDVLREPPRGLGAPEGWRRARQQQSSILYLAPDFRRDDLDLDRADMRRALSLAVDRDAVRAVAQEGAGQATAGTVPPSSPWYSLSEPESLPARPHEAARLLDGLGWRRESGARVRTREGRPLQLEALTQDAPLFRRAATAVQRSLASVGIDVRFRFVLPFAPFYEAAQQGADLILSKWLWPDPLEALYGFVGSDVGHPNWQHARVPEVDAALIRWRHAATDEELRNAAADVQETFASWLPYIPLFVPDDSWLIADGVEGFEPRNIGLYPEY